MAVSKIEEYRQKDGNDILKVFCKPNKAFPDGSFFFCDASEIDLVSSYNWSAHNNSVKNNYCIITSVYKELLYFHQELAYKYLAYYTSYVDHINRVEYDNVDYNLNASEAFENQRNRPSKGYSRHGNTFQAQLTFNGKHVILGSAKNEVDLLVLINFKRNELYKGYDYNFLLDRNLDKDLLNLERTGIISSEEATYQHVIRHASTNAWYVYRYGLEQYFKDNHIPIPSYSLDSQGFMIHPVTGQKLCPF